MKKIAVVFNSDYSTWPLGGMITYVDSVISMLGKEYEVDLWGCAVDGKKPEPLVINGDEYPILVNSESKTVKKIVPNVVRCFWKNLVNSKQLLIRNYDIIYFQLSASELGWLLGAQIYEHFGHYKMPKIILHQHGMSYGKQIAEKLDYLAMNCADLTFLTTSKDSVEKHARHVKKQVKWMPSMVDMNYFAPVADKKLLRKKLNLRTDKTIFVYTGRITDWKNPLLLLDAFESFQAHNDNSGLLIYVGNGDKLDALKTAVDVKNLNEEVVLAGARNRLELREYLQAADIFVIPSKGEGVSVATLEALATDLPVVAFDVEGMSSVVEPDINGYLVKGQNAKEFGEGMQVVSNRLAKYTPRKSIEAYSCESVERMLLDAIKYINN